METKKGIRENDGCGIFTKETQTLMKDHDIENIIKIDKIDSADNKKSCCYQFLLID